MSCIAAMPAVRVADQGAWWLPASARRAMLGGLADRPRHPAAPVGPRLGSKVIERLAADLREPSWIAVFARNLYAGLCRAWRTPTLCSKVRCTVGGSTSAPCSTSSKTQLCGCATPSRHRAEVGLAPRTPTSARLHERRGRPSPTSAPACRHRIRTGARDAERPVPVDFFWVWATRPTSATSKMRWCATSPDSCWNWAAALPSSGQFRLEVRR